MKENTSHTVILADISFISSLCNKLLNALKIKTYYRGQYDADLVSSQPSDVFYESAEALRQFLNGAIDLKTAQRQAQCFSLKGEFLYLMGKRLFMWTFRYPIDYAYMVSRGASKTKGDMLLSVAGNLRVQVKESLGIKEQSRLVMVLSVIAYAFRKIRLASVTIAKAMYVSFKLWTWLLREEHRRIKDLREQFLWIPGGSDELSFDEGNLSLPMYLRDFVRAGSLIGRRFAVYCPFLKNGPSWDEPESFAVESLKKIHPKLEWNDFLKAQWDLLKVIGHVLSAIFRKDGALECLSLIPELKIHLIWIKSARPNALFINESCMAVPHPMVHAAKEAGIPVLMVLYASNIEPIVLKNENRDIMPVEAEGLLLDHLFVWTQKARRWWSKAGYQPNCIHVAGPQMFASARRVSKKDIHKLTIGLFDVLPVHISKLLQWGKGENFKNVDYFFQFRKQAYKAILETFGRDIKIIHKPKRKASIIRDMNCLKELKNEFPELDQIIEVKDPNANPWHVLDETDLVISMPFTSLSEAALTMGKPSVFFDPSGLVLPRRDDEVPCLSSQDELSRWLSEMKEKVGRGENIQAEPGKFGSENLAHVFERIFNNDFMGTVENNAEKDLSREENLLSKRM